MQQIKLPLTLADYIQAINTKFDFMEDKMQKPENKIVNGIEYKTVPEYAMYSCATCVADEDPQLCAMLSAKIDCNDYSIVWEKADVTKKSIELSELNEVEQKLNENHGHYYKNVSHLKTIDPYRILDLYEVTDPCLAHVAKKALVTGGRGYKDINKDVQDMIDTLIRWQRMQAENEEAVD